MLEYGVLEQHLCLPDCGLCLCLCVWGRGAELALREALAALEEEKSARRNESARFRAVEIAFDAKAVALFLSPSSSSST